jgi:hypothetical protein
MNAASVMNAPGDLLDTMSARLAARPAAPRRSAAELWRQASRQAPALRPAAPLWREALSAARPVRVERVGFALLVAAGIGAVGWLAAKLVEFTAHWEAFAATVSNLLR